jgi:hypothetical protein
VPAAARLLRVPMRPVEPEPWALGARLRDKPSGVHQLTVRAGSPADGRAVDELAGLPGKAWVRFIVQDGHGQLVPLKPGEPPGGGDLGDTAAWLTTRQAEVLRLAAAALVAKEIARRLGISDDDGKDRAGGEGSRGAEPMTFPHIRGQEAVSTWN